LSQSCFFAGLQQYLTYIKNVCFFVEFSTFRCVVLSVFRFQYLAIILNLMIGS